MKKNIAVFILLIILASSFKYRTKAKESSQPFLPDRIRNMVPLKQEAAPSFDETITLLQQANLQMANGDPQLFKSMWLQSEEVTIFGGDNNTALKGWKEIEASLGAMKEPITKVDTYSFEKIASDQGEQQAYLLQKEHYKLANGETRDLQVTVVFRKENEAWKIVHRHADSVEVLAQSDKNSK
ncbi:nuclear transport factor 2 family protein [Dyadobacter sp. CY343]|uniref:nuclear transport factor 2 family protein n=1 Tax=Dyadobacter sp. CY343 TaxID=2907299 RepID=UPI001F3FEC98|nr:nuclear transport factor 2 family protein [Dyadobacter sp. CY343]MCE7061284.1 nuclear transport factor 2 family protein [Dyadobacter sp. CY343]